MRIDPFFEKQPPLSFVDQLKKPLHTVCPKYYGKSCLETGEVDAHGLYLASQYPDDPEGLLETVYTDIKEFFRVYGIGGDRYPIKIVKGKTECFEAYCLEIDKDGVVVIADDTEGVRRALIYIEDELRRREDAFLKVGKIKRVPHIQSRITRGFFSPTNRPPKKIDELYDDIDYYPEEYLNRLMHDGANGIWIDCSFAELLPSSIIEENGKESAIRIAKLNRVIEKCRRYGIGVYLFGIEPASFNFEKSQKYPELCGVKDHTGATFCVNSAQGKAYCREAGRRLTELIPKLAGFISITYGERITTCATTEGYNTMCPNCKGKKYGEVLAAAVEALRSGMREGNPKCKTISWTYGARTRMQIKKDWQEDICDYVKSAPSDASLLQNFDDMCYEEQLGEMRQGVDYWLSCVGPSALFAKTALLAKEHGKSMFAKMQVCCSHEMASVPYVPTPGILFKKYQAAHELGVEGIMQCWFFGNYPSLMSKAAGELAFDDFAEEDAFLIKLAGIYWGRRKAAAVVKAWKLFEQAYRQYPLNIMFSYYGPMHDGIAWKLALKPKNLSLARAWLGCDPVDGDRIGEALLNGHTLDEARILLNGMLDCWTKGVEILTSLPIVNDDEAEQLSVAEAIRLLFDSGRNIVEFYRLRDLLGREIGDTSETLKKLASIVKKEIKNSHNMILLCKKDSRLGYHSESEVYKFFPKKLEDRISQLKGLLEGEFLEVKKRIEEGLAPLAYYEGAEEKVGVKRYVMSKAGLNDAAWEKIGGENNSAFRIAYDKEHIYLELRSDCKIDFSICPEFKLLWPDAEMIVGADGVLRLGGDAFLYNSLFGEREKKEYAKYEQRRVFEEKGTHVVIVFELSKIGLDKIRPFKMKIVAGVESWCEDENPVRTLGKSAVSPEAYGWILPEQ